MADINNGLSLRVSVSAQENARIKGDLLIADKRTEQAKGKLRESEKQRQKQQAEIDYLKKESLKYKNQLDDYSRAMENKDLFSKLKQED